MYLDSFNFLNIWEIEYLGTGKTLLKRLFMSYHRLLTKSTKDKYKKESATDRDKWSTQMEISTKAHTKMGSAAAQESVNSERQGLFTKVNGVKTNLKVTVYFLLTLVK